MKKARTRIGRILMKHFTRKPLTERQRECAIDFIAEEMRTGKYPHKQAIAIGLSRARRECK